MPIPVHAVSTDIPLLSCQKALRTLVSIGIIRIGDETGRAHTFLGLIFSFLTFRDGGLIKSHWNPHKYLDF